MGAGVMYFFYLLNLLDQIQDFIIYAFKWKL